MFITQENTELKLVELSMVQRLNGCFEKKDVNLVD